uniref:DNA polymerase n=1 Tax=Coniophora puteana TaxID=80637 RepID=A0A896YUU9_9AGAM
MNKNVKIILNKNDFSEVSFPVGIYSTDKNIIKNIIKKLQSILKKSINKEVKLFILSRYKYEDGTISTLHKGQTITLDDQFAKKYSDFIINILDSKSNNYDFIKAETPITHMIFNFFIVPAGSEEKYSKWDSLDSKEKVQTVDKFNVNEKNYYLPLNRDYLSWGTALADTEEISLIQVDFRNKFGNIIVDKNTNEVQFKSKESSISFTDYDYTSDIFVREFESGTKFYLKAGKIVLKVKPTKTKYLESLLPAQPEPARIGTLDIETIVKDGVHTPYLFAFYDGTNSYTWFEKDSKKLFEFILKRKYSGYTIFAHNLSRFDVVFLFKNIAQLKPMGYNIEIIKKEDKIISIKISNGKGVSVTLKDSILLLPTSLAKLANQFGLNKGKLTEPVYVGNDPQYSFYSTEAQYSKEIERIEDFKIYKNKAEIYCNQDCIALYEVIIKFRELINENFHIDVVNYSTVPSLAFAIFRTHYLKPKIIPRTEDEVYNFIRGSYTGGSTEMYKPDGLNKDIYVYDVNSLYPAVMADNLFPTGKIYQFEGDPSILGQSKYWIGEALVSTKKDLYQPYLQIHHKTKGGWRTVAPNGDFKMVIHAPEYFNAIKDYNITVTKGYMFEKMSDIFHSYVQKMYALRQQYTKDQPMNFVAKLLLNSLYGRFGMQPSFHSNAFFTFDELQETIKNHEINNVMEISENIFFVSYISADIEDLDASLPKSKNISVSIASAVTAYARIYMSKFKNNEDFNLFYTDTDSIFVDSPIPDENVSSQLGALKLEYIFKDSIFISPKVYCGITKEGDKICKVKGFTQSKELTMSDFEALLHQNANKTLNHTKWFRNLFESSIVMKDTSYNLVQTDNKRELIFDQSGRAIETKAFKL